MSCWECLKRFFTYEDKEDHPGELSLYIQNQKRFIYEESVKLPPIYEEEESTWSLENKHEKSKYIKGFNDYINKNV